MPFFDKGKVVHFRLSAFDLGIVPAAVKNGLLSLMFTIGCTIKGYILNITLMKVIGEAALAAMNVQNNICAILGAIPMGAAGAFITLGGIYYGEQDRDSFVGLMRYALRIGMALSACAMLLLMAGFRVIPSLFFARTDAAWSVTSRMLLIFPCWLVINTLLGLLLKAYQSEGKPMFVNIFILVENLFIALFASCVSGILGTDAVWLAFPVSESICLLIIAGIVLVKQKRIAFTLPAWMLLPPDFGVLPEDCLEMRLWSMEDVLNISEKVIAFCTVRTNDRKKCMYAGLAVEEMAGNVVTHGFSDGKKHYLDIRLVFKEGFITIRLRDDCRSFDPKKRMDQFNPEDPAKNIGIRLIMKLATEVFYQGNAGINTLLIKI